MKRLCPRRSKEKNKIKSKRGFRLGRSRYNLSYQTELSIKNKQKTLSDNQWQELACTLCTQKDNSPERDSGKKRHLLADILLYPSWLRIHNETFQSRQIGWEAEDFGWQAIFCSFMQPVSFCSPNVFSDGFFWANFVLWSARRLITSPTVSLCCCFLFSLPDFLHHCAILVFVSKIFLYVSLKHWTPQVNKTVCYGFVRFQHKAITL